MILPAALGVSAQLVAWAGGPPAIDVETICGGIAVQSHFAGGAHDVTKVKAECLRSEKETRSNLEKQWSTFSAVDRESCTAVVLNGGASTYTELLTCLEMARDVRKLRGNPSEFLGPGR
jgi:hypothetical protein